MSIAGTVCWIFGFFLIGYNGKNFWITMLSVTLILAATLLF